MERYSEDNAEVTTPATMTGLAKKLDEIGRDVKMAVSTAGEAREFSQKAHDYIAGIHKARTMPLAAQVMILFAGSAVGGLGAGVVLSCVARAWHVLLG